MGLHHKLEHEFYNMADQTLIQLFPILLARLTLEFRQPIIDGKKMPYRSNRVEGIIVEIKYGNYVNLSWREMAIL